MKKHILFVALALSWAHQVICQSPKQARNIEVTINKNIEFLGFVYFLGYLGPQLEADDEPMFGGTIKQSQWYGYGLSVHRQYKAYENSKHLAVAKEMAGETETSAFVGLMLQLDDFPNAKFTDRIEPAYFLPFSPKGDVAEARQKASALVEALNRLCREVDFDAYLKQSRQKHEHVLEQVKESLPGAGFIPAMEQFYGSRFDRYTLVPSLTIPTGMGFGPDFKSDGKTCAFNVFGPLGVQQFANDSNLDMGFSDRKRLLELSTHEFGHPFVNPAVDQVPAKLIEATNKLFGPIKADMAGQGYPEWKMCLYEHFVRAGEIIIARNLGNDTAAEQLKNDYVNNRKFIYLPVILQELETYNKTRAVTYQQAVIKTMEKLHRKADEK